MSMLMSDDLPTFERPITANSGSLGLGHWLRFTLLLTYTAFFTRTCKGIFYVKHVLGLQASSLHEATSPLYRA